MDNILMCCLVSCLLIIFLLLLIIWIRSKKKYKEDWICVSKEQWLALKYNHHSKDRICVFSYDNRRNDPMIEKLRSINNRYCQKHGYDFLFFETYPANLPPYWMKVKIGKDLVDSGKYDYVMWLDSDACVHDHTIRLEHLFTFYKNAFFVMAPDNERWAAEFNAGVWIIKCGSLGKQFMKDWLARYNSSDWVYDHNKWKCNWCIWAGDAYEQGAGTRLLKSKTYAPYVIKLSWEVLQNDLPTKWSYTLHFAGKQGKTQIKSYEHIYRD